MSTNLICDNCMEKISGPPMVGPVEHWVLENQIDSFRLRDAPGLRLDLCSIECIAEWAAKVLDKRRESK